MITAAPWFVVAPTLQSFWKVAIPVTAVLVPTFIWPDLANAYRAVRPSVEDKLTHYKVRNASSSWFLAPLFWVSLTYKTYAAVNLQNGHRRRR